MKQKVYAYIVHQGRLLVFRHTQFPEAGIQVPGGTLEEGELPQEGVLREASEETGLRNLRLLRSLGTEIIEIEGILVQRHYFVLGLEGEPPETWLSCEWHPSDGSPAPIEFEFYWAEPGSLELAGGLDVKLKRL